MYYGNLKKSNEIHKIIFFFLKILSLISVVNRNAQCELKIYNKKILQFFKNSFHSNIISSFVPELSVDNKKFGAKTKKIKKCLWFQLRLCARLFLYFNKICETEKKKFMSANKHLKACPTSLKENLFFIPCHATRIYN